MIFSFINTILKNQITLININNQKKSVKSFLEISRSERKGKGKVSFYLFKTEASVEAL